MIEFARPHAKDPHKELAARMLARKSLTDFTCYTYSSYRPESFHELVASTLERVLAGEIRRLMIFAPPQSGKSQLSSVHFPAFWLAHRPDDNVISTSYAASLAHSHSRETRAIVESAEFGRMFPGIGVNQGSRAVDNWRLTGRRGGLLASGVGGPLTGFGANLGLIDDPLKSWQEAQSETIREQLWDWWKGTFRTRIRENGAIVLIMSRWHTDDLGGRLLLAEQPEQWNVLRLPALAETQEERDENNRLLGLPPGMLDPLRREPGEALCPGRFSRETLLDIKKDVGSLVWAGAYQGVPRAAGGNRFQMSWFRMVDAAPAGGQWCRFWDLASVEGGGDFTAGVKMARHGGAFYVEDVVLGQWSPAQRDKIIKQTARIDGRAVKIRIEQEPGSAGKSVVDAYIRLLAGYAVAGVRSTGSKTVRVEPLAAQAEAGNVFLVRAAWNSAFLDEITGFPSGRFDDMTDAASGAFLALTSEDTSERPTPRMDALEALRAVTGRDREPAFSYDPAEEIAARLRKRARRERTPHLWEPGQRRRQRRW